MGEGASRVCYTLYQGVHHVGCLMMRVDDYCPPLGIFHLALDLVEAMVPGQDGEGNVFGQQAVHPAHLKPQTCAYWLTFRVNTEFRCPFWKATFLIQAF